MLDETERANSVFILAPQCSSNNPNKQQQLNPDHPPPNSPMTPTPPFQRRNLILGKKNKSLTNNESTNSIAQLLTLERDF